MKKIAAILALMLVISPLGAFAFDLPDYTKEARLVERATCDQTRTIVELYRNDQYAIIKINIHVGNTFYHYLELIIQSERFLLKKADSKDLMELTHEQWDATLQKEAPHTYNGLHGNPSDCVNVN